MDYNAEKDARIKVREGDSGERQLIVEASSHVVEYVGSVFGQ